MSGVIAPAIPSCGEEFLSPDEGENAWTLQKDIGVGGFGIVKLFVNKTTGEKLVLKECRITNLSQDFMDRWYGELKIIKRLHHPNVIRAIDEPPGLNYEPLGNNVPVICMEYCDKGDLRQVLRDPKNCCGLTEDQTRQICGDINAGIRFLHSQKVIHRDLKPENILIKQVDEMRVVYKLTDFGYSKSYDQNSVCTSLVGTMQYVAPEVIKSRLYHSSVDFWSFGVIVFECITGKRPFLHGIPSNNIAWIDYVARKNPQDIYIYYSKESTTPLSSPHIPQPHRLSRTFESLITSWLQTALHYDPEMRGGRKRPSDDAPCLSNMDHILTSKVMSAVCMSTGEEYFFKVEQDTTYSMLSQQISGLCNESHQQPFQILPSGRMPEGSDLVCADMAGHLGRVYVFNTSLVPSFKLMHTSTEAVTTITAYGDSSLVIHELREVYAQVFFHIRKYHSFFMRLQEGHSGILSQLTQQCTSVQNLQRQLADEYLVTKEIVGLVLKMHMDDCATLSSLLQQDKVPQTLSENLDARQSSTEFLQQRGKNLQALNEDLVRLREEAHSYVCMADDLQTSYDASYNRLEEYQQNYVAAACDLYKEVKEKKTFIQGRSMQDILLKATHEAQSIIEECLNGYNYGETYVALRSHLQLMAKKLEQIQRIRMEALQMKDTLRESLWDIIVESNSPMNSLRGHLYRKQSVDGPIVMNIDQNNGATQDGRPEGEFGRQISSASISSVESVTDTKLHQSICNLHRHVSEEENTRLIHKNKELRQKIESFSRSSSTPESNGRSPPSEARNN